MRRGILDFYFGNEQIHLGKEHNSGNDRRWLTPGRIGKTVKQSVNGHLLNSDYEFSSV